jgi:AraC-like DNA-binding protein
MLCRVAAAAEYTLVRAMLLRHEGFRRLCRARDLLRELREPSPSIANLASEVQISPFHFIRQFEAVFGVTPTSFASKPAWMPPSTCSRWGTIL